MAYSHCMRTGSVQGQGHGQGMGKGTMGSNIS